MRQWRDSYGVVVNKHLEKAGLDVRIDPRSYKDQGLDLIPQPKMGPKAWDRIDRGKPCNKLEDLERVRKKNRSLLHKNPGLVLDSITRYQSTFTKRDIAKFLNRYIDDEKEFYQLRSQVEALPELIKISTDSKKGEEVYTTHFMLKLEISLVKTSGALAHTHKCPPHLSGREWLITEASDKLKEGGSSSSGLSGDQVAAIHHMTNDGQLKVVVGYAGAGKTTCLETAKKVWASSGYRVVGAAPTGRAAENLEGSGIASKTLHKWEHEWKEGREQLDRQSILVVDEAGMVDARRLHSLLKESEKTGFKVVLVGDPEQLSPIEAGCGLRTVMDKAGYCSISTVVRQYKDWQREATLK
jgi:Ti-type conjugative transfer relaxase TraA